MKYFQIISCSNDLGSCCNDKALSSLFVSFNNVINLIQLIVPIILLVMVSIDLMKLVMNPDDKNKLKPIKNKVTAAVIVFFIPVFMNTVIGFVSESENKSFNFAACIKESKNLKIDNNAKYISISDEETSSVISKEKDYDSGKKKDSNNNKTSIGEKIAARTCTVGDNSVKTVYNDSHAEAKIVRKANGQEVVNYAKSWIGKLTYEFTAQGELKAGGQCSCSHFVYQVLKHFDIIEGNFIRSTVWGSCSVKGTTMYSNYSKLAPGDVVFMSLGGTAGHVGIYAGNGKVVDCNTGRGVAMSSAKGYTSFIHLNAYD